jgi:hypothetical protein
MWPTTRPGSCVPLSDVERSILTAAGTAPQQHVRGQAVAIVLAKTGTDAEDARALLAASFMASTQPSFHLIPKGDAMTAEDDFERAYNVLAEETTDFTDVRIETLHSSLLRDGAALAPLRMIIGLTHNELAVTTKLIAPDSKVTGNALKGLERRAAPTGAAASARRAALLALVSATIVAAMDRRVLTVPEASTESFHSKLDKRDTRDGWASVARDAGGVPYFVLLYQRFVGGVWRQVQDAYSEVKGDALLEVPLTAMFEREGIPFHRSQRGASGATQTAQQFGINPGPDFLLPDTTPTVIVESKVGEDGGTVRDKAARLKTLATAGARRGLVVCAVVDGKGWSERPTALVEVVIATGGRTYSLETLRHLLKVPEVAALMGTAPPSEP